MFDFNYIFCVSLLGFTKEDYVNMLKKDEILSESQSKVLILNGNEENVYDNCSMELVTDKATKPLQLLHQHQQDSEKDKFVCPFSGLPAKHLTIMNSPKYGLLYRIEKKIFFDQTKHYYAGVLNRWMMLYASNSNDMKPTACFYIKDIGIDTVFDGNGKKREHLFHVMTNNGKRYQFQAISHNDMSEWIAVINKLIKDDENVESKNNKFDEIEQNKSEIIKDKITNLRKLPTPPPPSPTLSKNYYSNHRVSCKSISNNEEMIYEEPCSVSNVKETQDNCYDIVSYNSSCSEHPPDLPIKTGKKNNSDNHNMKHEYDVPKSTKPQNYTQVDVDVDVNVDIDADIIQDNEITITADKDSVCGMKVSEVKALLSTQRIILSPPTPEDKKRPKIVLREKEVNKVPRSPVKTWFLKQITKSGEKSKKSKKSRSSLGNIKNNEDSFDDNPNTDSVSKNVKGGKVNMIISQLEANGHIKILSKSFKNRKSMTMDVSEEYEAVSIKDGKV